MFNSGARPVPVPMTRSEKIIDIVSLGVILLTVSVVMLKWDQFPMEVVSHFNALGQPDEWGTKLNLLVVPGVQILMVFIPMTMLRSFPNAFIHMWYKSGTDPQAQYMIGRIQMAWSKLIILIFLSVINLNMVLMASNIYIKIFPAALFIFLFFLFGVEVYYSRLAKRYA